MHKPRLILADEPTGNLDPRTAAQVMDVLVTHSKAAVARANRVLHLTVQGLQEARSRAAYSTAPQKWPRQAVPVHPP